MSQRKSQQFKIKSQFGEEIYNAHFDNIPDEWQNKIKDCDTFVNLHIDSLLWMKYDMNWLQYYYSFPRPQTEVEKYPHSFDDNSYILLHLAARKKGDHEMESWYIEKLINDLVSKTLYNLVIISIDECADIYSKFKDNNRITICNPTIYEIFSLAKGCKMFFGIDSGIRYIPLHYGKPSFVFSKYTTQIGQPALSHLTRWLIYPQFCLPLHFNSGEVIKIVNNIYKDSAYILYPQIQQGIENIIVDRQIAVL